MVAGSRADAPSVLRSPFFPTICSALRTPKCDRSDARLLARAARFDFTAPRLRQVRSIGTFHRATRTRRDTSIRTSYHLAETRPTHRSIVKIIDLDFFHWTRVVDYLSFGSPTVNRARAKFRLARRTSRVLYRPRSRTNYRSSRAEEREVEFIARLYFRGNLTRVCRSRSRTMINSRA